MAEHITMSIFDFLDFCFWLLSPSALVSRDSVYTVSIVSWASWESYLDAPSCLESPSLFVEKEKLWLLCLREGKVDSSLKLFRLLSWLRWTQETNSEHLSE